MVRWARIAARRAMGCLGGGGALLAATVTAA
jgi:hypothetical protein